MKKILITTILCALTVSGANAAWKEGVDSSCWVKNQNHFYFCGKVAHREKGTWPNQNKWFDTCAGYKRRDGDTPHYYYAYKKDEDNSNGKAIIDGSRYYCCDGTTTKTGRWVIGYGADPDLLFTTTISPELHLLGADLTTANNYDKNKIKDECTYTVREKTVCGDYVIELNSEVCPTAEEMCSNDGGVIRNGKCVEPCEYGTVFESKTSNRCITCPETSYSGVISKTGEADYCLVCNERTQMFINGKCVSKTSSNMVQYTKNVMAKCFACTDIGTFKQCINAVKNSSINSNSQLKIKCLLN